MPLHTENTGKGKRVVLAFSGGTDSCYSAVKLSGLGYSVEALVLDMTGDGEFLRSARARAQSIGIHCKILDVREAFRRSVADYFTAEYLSGCTPAPCTVCNPLVKWKFLYEYATGNGFDHIATGHYFRLTESGGNHFVTRAADAAKDQSYYLWMVPQEALAMALTPMGGEIKSEVVARAAAPVQKESMGVCFLGGSDYRGFLRHRAGDHPSCRPGEVTDRAGNPVGRHDGCAFYTPGQKRGLSLPSGWAVTGIDAARNRVITGPGDELFSSRLVLENCIIIGDRLHGNFIPEIWIRGIGRNPRGRAHFTQNPRNNIRDCVMDTGYLPNHPVDKTGTGSMSRLILDLTEPAWAPAVGQPVVFYDGDLVVGGGWLSGFA